MKQRLRVLGERNFRWFLLGQSASQLGDMMAPVALAFAVLGLTGSAADLGLVLIARTVPLIAFMLLGGVLADRLPRTAVMIGADLARLACQGVMAALLLTGHAQVWMLAALQFVHGGASALFTPAVSGLIRETVGTESLQDANALRGFAQSAAYVAGPALAGLLVATAGAGWAIAVDAATFAASAAFLGLLRLPAKPLPATRMLRDLAEGWREFRARRWVWSFIGAASLVNMWQAALHVLGPVAATAALGGAGAWGLILACFGAGSIAGGALALAVKPVHPLRTAVCWDLVFPLQLLLLALGAPAAGVAAVAFLGGVSLMVSNTLWETTLQRHIPEDRLSRVSSYEWLGSYAGYPLGLLLVPALHTGLGLHNALWVAFLCQLLPSLALLLVRDVRDIGAVPAEPEPRRTGT
ncbi:MFS transporter [Planomonospora venezuelensis]|uniref:MFS family permease n=1 Tax=Planomonospora venezuelensis TaxID=1999 RepID=A0A841DE33_PLAVE|nr:MFS transporter [Planomonospora venezuelensis]MBB5965546.1 MFS family permease [Planomonospora venezuelensis]GIN03025.1 MFS transporter [Planomonospora venezuelensis]